MNALTYYTNPQSRGRIAHWMLEELGQPYQTVWLEYGAAMKAPAAGAAPGGCQNLQ